VLVCLFCCFVTNSTMLYIVRWMKIAHIWDSLQCIESHSYANIISFFASWENHFVEFRILKRSFEFQFSDRSKTTALQKVLCPCFVWVPPIPPNKQWWLSKPIKLLDNIIQQVCHDRSDIKKCQGLDPLFTVNRQQDGAASAKRGSTKRLLSLSCRSTKAIGISFSSFLVVFTGRFWITVDCRSGIPYWLQPGTTRIFAMP